MSPMFSRYQVEVYTNGRFVSTFNVEAANALAAINRVEANYGEPPEINYKTVYHEDGTVEHVLVVSGWHGYSFRARKIGSASR